MKKKLLAIAIAVCGTFGMVASAQMPDKSYKPQKFTDFAFEGILLDIDQQTKIDSINAATFKECPMQQTCCEGNEAADQQCGNAQCQQTENAGCDTAQCAVKRNGHRHGMFHGRMNAMRPTPEYVAAVKEVLTPEQYVTFLENIVTMPMPEPGQMMAPGQFPGQGQRVAMRPGQRVDKVHSKDRNKDKAKDKKQGKQKKDKQKKDKQKNK